VLQREKERKPHQSVYFFPKPQHKKKEEDDAKNGFVLYYKNIERALGAQERREEGEGKQVAVEGVCGW
jgi:hypothetical protein